jgi:hypothetical protein
MSEPRRYSDADVRDIVERALEASGTPASSIDHGDLLALGEQIGITPEAMSRAATEVAARRLDATATRAIKGRRRKWLAAHAALFAVLNGLFFTVNALTTPGEWWFLFSVFFWGLALAAHAAYALFAGTSPGALERERRKLGPPPKLRVATSSSNTASASTDSPAHEPEIVPAPPRNVSRS